MHNSIKPVLSFWVQTSQGSSTDGLLVNTSMHSIVMGEGRVERLRRKAAEGPNATLSPLKDNRLSQSDGVLLNDSGFTYFT